MEFTVKNLWNGQPCNENEVAFHLKKYDGGIIVEIKAPFYDDPPPPLLEKGQPLYELWNYEVVEIFFLSSKHDNMYLEVEFGPYGQHLGLLLKGQRNCLIHSFPMKYSSEIDKQKKIWKGIAHIPNEYFPPNVDKFNAYTIHGPENDRIFKSLFPFDPELPLDFHRLEFFQDFDFHVDQKSVSEFWKDALKTHDGSNPLGQPWSK